MAVLSSSHRLSSCTRCLSVADAEWLGGAMADAAAQQARACKLTHERDPAPPLVEIMCVQVKHAWQAIRALWTCAEPSSVHRMLCKYVMHHSWSLPLLARQFHFKMRH